MKEMLYILSDVWDYVLTECFIGLVMDMSNEVRKFLSGCGFFEQQADEGYVVQFRNIYSDGLVDVLLCLDGLYEVHLNGECLCISMEDEVFNMVEVLDHTCDV